jgi:hypothetical protein
VFVVDGPLPKYGIRRNTVVAHYVRNETLRSLPGYSTGERVVLPYPCKNRLSAGLHRFHRLHGAPPLTRAKVSSRLSAELA